MASSRPLYYVRPDDSTVFSLNDDGATYSTKESKEQFPNHYHSKYTEEVLLSHNFFAVEESELPLMAKRQKLYYDRLSEECCRNNSGHGQDEDD